MIFFRRTCATASRSTSTARAAAASDAQRGERRRPEATDASARRSACGSAQAPDPPQTHKSDGMSSRGWNAPLHASQLEMR